MPRKSLSFWGSYGICRQYNISDTGRRTSPGYSSRSWRSPARAGDISAFPVFEELPENVQYEIIASAAADDVAQFHKLHQVSRKVKEICDSAYVLSFACIEKPVRLRTMEAVDAFTSYVHRCADAGNANANFLLGREEYFGQFNDEDTRARGLQRIASAGAMGLEDAHILHGMILVCIGGEGRQNGLDILRKLTPILLTPSNVVGMEDRWDPYRREFFKFGMEKLFELRRSYVRERCDCDGYTSNFFFQEHEDWHQYSGWHDPPEWGRFDKFKGLPTVMGCEVCLCHEMIRICLISS